MKNEQLLAAVLALPAADMMTATKIDDPIGAGTYYRADTVARLLATERERWAAEAKAAIALIEAHQHEAALRTLVDAIARA